METEAKTLNNSTKSKNRIPLWAMLATHLLPTFIAVLAVMCLVLINFIGESNILNTITQLFIVFYPYFAVTCGVMSIITEIINIKTDKITESTILLTVNAIRILCAVIIFAVL